MCHVFRADGLMCVQFVVWIGQIKYILCANGSVSVPAIHQKQITYFKMPMSVIEGSASGETERSPWWINERVAYAANRRNLTRSKNISFDIIALCLAKHYVNITVSHVVSISCSYIIDMKMASRLPRKCFKTNSGSRGATMDVGCLVSNSYLIPSRLPNGKLARSLATKYAPVFAE